MKRNEMQIKLNADLNGHAKGSIITIAAHNKIPLNQFWRDRLRDSETDNCIEIVQPKSSNSGRSKSK